MPGVSREQIEQARNADLFAYPERYENGVLKRDGCRLSLGGTSPVALTAFLDRHPEIRRVNLYMDNDFAGLKNARCPEYDPPMVKATPLGSDGAVAPSDFSSDETNRRGQY